MSQRVCSPREIFTDKHNNRVHEFTATAKAVNIMVIS